MARDRIRAARSASWAAASSAACSAWPPRGWAIAATSTPRRKTVWRRKYAPASLAPTGTMHPRSPPSPQDCAVDHLRVRERAGRAPLAAIDGRQARARNAQCARELRRTGWPKSASSKALGGRPAPYFAKVSTGRPILPPALVAIGVPGILKTRRDGYDGKGQWPVIAAPADARRHQRPRRAGWSMKAGSTSPPSSRSSSCAGATARCGSGIRRATGTESGILVRSEFPPPAIVDRTGGPAARDLARKVADALDYVRRAHARILRHPSSGPGVQ